MKILHEIQYHTLLGADMMLDSHHVRIPCDILRLARNETDRDILSSEESDLVKKQVMTMGIPQQRMRVDLDMFRNMFNLRTCLCGICETLRTELQHHVHSGPRWSKICSYLEDEDVLCPFLNRIYSSIRGSFCRWKVCYRCFLEGNLPYKPEIEPITQLIDATVFDVHERDNREGQCSTHGKFFQPYCIGEPPQFICLLSETKLTARKVILHPLELVWNGKSVLSETRSGFAYIPNLQRWPSTIPYRIEYDASLYPIDGKGLGLLQYTYVLSRESKPLPFSPRLEDLLHSTGPEKHIWTLQNAIMGTANEGITVNGDYFFLSSRNENSRENGCAKHSRFSDLQNSRQDSELAAQSYNNEESKNAIRSSFRNDIQGRERKELATSYEQKRNSCEKDIIDSDKLKTYVKGDPLYCQPHEVSTLSDDDDQHDVMDFDASHERNFLFEKAVHVAEKNEKRKMKTIERLRERSRRHPTDENEYKIMKKKLCTARSREKAASGEALRYMTNENIVPGKKKAIFQQENKPLLSQNSFRTSYSPIETMEYRSNFLRAPPSWFREDKIEDTNSTLNINAACKLLQENKYPFVRSSICEDDVGKISFDFPSSPSSEKYWSMTVHVDIDSIDVITVPLGGTAFQVSETSISLSWNQSFSRDDEVLTRNNGFIRFSGAYSEYYPGNYFGQNITTNAGFKRNFEDENVLNNPVQVQIGSINLSWSLPLKVFIMVPSKSLLYLLRGDGALLELFDNMAYGVESRGSKSSARTKVNQMVWYIATSSLLLFCSIGSKDGSSPGVWSRDLCCAFASVDSRRDKIHDSKYGHLSDFNCVQSLSPGTLTIGLCLFARHQKALEQHAEVPEHLRSSALNDLEKYRLPGDLQGLVNPAMLPILQEEIGSTVCLEWFRTFWTSGTHRLGNFVKLQSDPKRRNKKAFPSNGSCNEAFGNRCLCLEDMLPFSEAIFRGTVHGLKQTAFTEMQLNVLQRRISEAFDPSCFQDGTIDVAYVFHGPVGSDLSVHLRKELVEDNRVSPQNILTPIGCEKRLREMGAYFSGSPGYPVFVGISTRRGLCGKSDSGITFSGIRKLKAYHTKWKGDSFRGRTFYETPAAKKIEKTLNNSRALYERVVSVQQDGYQVLEELISDLNENLNQINHNIEHRTNFNGTYQNTDGFRLEYTCFFDEFFHFLKEPVDILRMQEERMKMSQEDLYTVLDQNLDYFPWWMTIEPHHRIRKKFPLSLVSSRALHNFCLTLEAKALNLSIEVYVRGMALVSKKGTEDLRCSPQSQFIEQLVERAPSTKVAAKFVSITATALFRLAYRQVNNMLCNITVGAPSTMDGWMSATGISASWWYSGYPAIILSRLCRFPAFKSGYDVASITGVVSTVSKRGAIILSCDDDIFLPASLTYRNISQHRAVKALRISESDEENNMDSILSWINELIGDVPRLTTCEVMESSSLIGAFIVKMLMADLGYTMLCSSSNTDVANEDLFEKKFSEITDRENLVELSSMSNRNEMWPEGYRIDRPISPIVRNIDVAETGLEHLNHIFSFNISPTLVVQDSDRTCESLSVSDDGFISDGDFINSLFREAYCRQERTKSMANGSSQRKWHSVLAVEAIIDVFNHFKIRKHLPRFLRDTSRNISRNMKSAGFETICPLFKTHPSGFRKEERSLWGPEMAFTRMLFSQETISLEPIFETNVETRSNQNQPTVAFPNATNGNQSIPPEWIRKIKNMKDVLYQLIDIRSSLELNSPEWLHLTEECQQASERFWSLPNVEDILILTLQRRFNAVQEEENLVHLDLIWSKTLLEKLVQIRKSVKDEGLCCFVSNQEIVAARDSSDIKSVRNALQHPWGSLYPKPGLIYKKKTRVKQAGKLFSSSFPLFFKTRNAKDTADKESTMFLKHCCTYNVEDVYQYLKAGYDENMYSRRSQWRLAPTRVIADLILEQDKRKQ